MSDSPESSSPVVAQSAASAEDKARALRKTRVGIVVSNKMQKTAVVETVSRVPHPKFRKIVKQSKKFYAHDEENKAQVGDLVRIMETRPLSRLKCWRLVEVLKH